MSILETNVKIENLKKYIERHGKWKTKKNQMKILELKNTITKM